MCPHHERALLSRETFDSVRVYLDSYHFMSFLFSGVNNSVRFLVSDIVFAKRDLGTYVRLLECNVGYYTIADNLLRKQILQLVQSLLRKEK